MKKVLGFITLFFCLFICSGCLRKYKLINEIENKYVEYVDNITIHNLEEAITHGSEVAKSCSIGIRTKVDGIILDKEQDGSGVIIDRVKSNDEYKYYAITNRHVIEANKEVNVDIYLGPKIGYVSGSIVYIDSNIDIALVTFKTGAILSVAKTTSSLIKAGQFAISVGSPYDIELLYNSVTVGSISAIDRVVEEKSTSGRLVDNHYIQHSCHINPGNSGGGLFNIYGELLGINTWKIKGDRNDYIEGISFAIPYSDILPIINNKIPKH